MHPDSDSQHRPTARETPFNQFVAAGLAQPTHCRRGVSITGDNKAFRVHDSIAIERDNHRRASSFEQLDQGRNITGSEVEDCY
jgi:hypothetical protein